MLQDNKSEVAPKFKFKDLVVVYNIQPGSYKYNMILLKEKISPSTLVSEEELEAMIKKRFKLERR